MLNASVSVIVGLSLTGTTLTERAKDWLPELASPEPSSTVTKTVNAPEKSGEGVMVLPECA